MVIQIVSLWLWAKININDNFFPPKHLNLSRHYRPNCLCVVKKIIMCEKLGFKIGMLKLKSSINQMQETHWDIGTRKNLQ